jgi:hypothetical protein
VKTKSGCEDTILGQMLPPRGGVSNYFSENSSDLGHYFCHPPQKKVGLHFGWTPPTRAEAAHVRASADRERAAAMEVSGLGKKYDLLLHLVIISHLGFGERAPGAGRRLPMCDEKSGVTIMVNGVWKV